ncbi:peptide/nickel transport system substrate-binding protein [Bradyrhizobium sp. USDA 4518]|uniref:ABC transporter substrate-binding protein n=1 Tax=Bradyrhizobium TaxID=374 RepID=UPI001142E5C3|nr:MULTISPECIES: ABC transporter substrate-binding protein [Bradyrhizobium]MCC8946891.1 ABC transporter substrate-binding protein [Bradyrhizobium brasilense]MCP1834794.1 4-phytase/acid phosphatase/peptide/nickel transport system substrate-binding protein [Bradyrhizobium sp. USDA 4545]MCP1919539.1 4-phytase/acid phosphatase/peptide/nickel transport system substrate-binding protein [Bradyrhizobium sp. USDA 4532]NLS72568.1 ABC transporter substrate-binding protein [Bradyrhizobium brasilense]
MKLVGRAHAVARIFLVAGFSAAAFAASANAQKLGGTLNVGQELDIPGFDPLKVGVYDTSANTAAAAIFDTLTTLDDKGEVKPKLALSWEHSEDFKTWTIKLRPGVKFHDGTPFNAQAVKENFDRQKDPANKCRCAFYITNIISVNPVDDLTVVYNFSDPAVNFPATQTIQSSNNVMQSPTAWKTKGDDYNRNPVGTGPYILKSWTAGDRMVLEKNPDYWNKGKPYLDRIVLKPLPDAQSRFASLQSGEADIIWDDEADADNIIRARKDTSLTVHTYEGSGAAVAAFNTKVPPFDDVRVRQALVMALDRTKMSQAITNGLARPASNPYGDGSWVKCKDDGALPYDVEKAKALIKDYGKPVEFKMLVTATPRGRTGGQVLQQFWKRIGANMEIEQVDQATIPPRAFMRQFQLTPWRIVDLADPDPQMYANFHTGSPVALANYSNPELDRLLEHARTTADVAQRTEDYCAISRLINKEAIWFWTFQNTYYAISSAKVKGVPKMFNGVLDVSDAWKE